MRIFHCFFAGEEYDLAGYEKKEIQQENQKSKCKMKNDSVKLKTICTG
jgi:hypothetical protein